MKEGSKYAAVLFDLDGTLISNYVAIHKCLAESFGEFGIPAPSYDSVFHTVGGSILITIRKLLKPLGAEEKADAVAKRYLELFPRHIFDGLSTMPYAGELLAELKRRGFKLACFTNKQQDGAEPILERTKLLPYLDAVIGTTLHSPRKPEKAFTESALKILGVSAAETLGIGDSPYDYMAARVCGLDSALVATGGDSRRFLEAECPESVGVFSDFRELAESVFGIAL